MTSPRVIGARFLWILGTGGANAAFQSGFSPEFWKIFDALSLGVAIIGGEAEEEL